MADMKPAPAKLVEVPKTVSDVLQAVQIALDNYEDIFSDFDPSPYETRALSDDFLAELRKRYAETAKGELLVNFTLPASGRSKKTEALIRRRLNAYFKHRLADVSGRINRSRKNGIFRISAGILVSIPVVLADYFLIPPSIVILLSVLTWYALWSGFDRVFDIPSDLSKERRFNLKFLKAKYNFFDEEQVLRSIYSSSYR